MLSGDYTTCTTLYQLMILLIEFGNKEPFHRLVGKDVKPAPGLLAENAFAPLGRRVGLPFGVADQIFGSLNTSSGEAFRIACAACLQSLPVLLYQLQSVQCPAVIIGFFPDFLKGVFREVSAQPEKIVDRPFCIIDKPSDSVF